MLPPPPLPNRERDGAWRHQQGWETDQGATLITITWVISVHFSLLKGRGWLGSTLLKRRRHWPMQREDCRLLS